MDMDSPWWLRRKTAVNCSAKDPTGESALPFVLSFDVKPYTVYCLNPPGDDGCPIGICPNPDIAGVLVRTAHYITVLCLTILIFHAPKRVKDAFYYQMSTVYALLITCIVSLSQGNITQPHATVATLIASSPVSVYFLVYSIRAFWGEHRLEEVLGKKKYLNRGLVFIAVVIWVVIFVFTRNVVGKRFPQASCGNISISGVFRLGFTCSGPYWFLCGPLVPVAIVVALSWLISIFLARKEIWPPGERYQPKFATVWKTIGRRYPLVFLVSIGLIPMVFWQWMVESIVPANDSGLWDPSFSFGQVLALFIAVPPFLQVCKLLPQLWSWIINLPWIACCRRRPRRTTPDFTEKIDLSLEATYYTHPESRTSPEGIGRFPEGEQEMRESVVLPNPDQHHEA